MLTAEVIMEECRMQMQTKGKTTSLRHMPGLKVGCNKGDDAIDFLAATALRCNT